jgi:DNA-binding transcriptional ArsR family regulator
MPLLARKPFLGASLAPEWWLVKQEQFGYHRSMDDTPDLSRLARTIGDATRIRMLTLLMDGRALTAKELAYSAGVEPATATAHLNRLTGDRFITARAQGRYKYFRLASAEVAHFMETLMVVAPPAQSLRQSPPGGDPIRAARFCYDHLAGRLGTRLTDALLAKGWVRLSKQAFAVTKAGEAEFRELGIDLTALARNRRKFAYPCLDWSERRDHLGGALGAALAERLLAMEWIDRSRDSRVVTVTPAGQRGLAKRFGVKLG